MKANKQTNEQQRQNPQITTPKQAVNKKLAV